MSLICQINVSGWGAEQKLGWKDTFTSDLKSRSRSLTWGVPHRDHAPWGLVCSLAAS